MKQNILDPPFDFKLSQDRRTQTSSICIAFIYYDYYVYLKFFW